MPDSDYRASFDHAGSRAQELASVTLVLPDPPARTADDTDFLNRLLDTAGPLGWRWTALQMVRPGHSPREDVAEHHREVYDKLVALIEQAERLRTDLEDGSLSNEDVGADCMGIEDAAGALEKIAAELPEEENEDADDETT